MDELWIIDETLAGMDSVVKSFADVSKRMIALSRDAEA